MSRSISSRLRLTPSVQARPRRLAQVSSFLDQRGEDLLVGGLLALIAIGVVELAFAFITL